MDFKKLLEKELKEFEKEKKTLKKSYTTKKDLLEAYIKENPWTSVGAAFLAGYIIGKLR